MSRNVTQIYRKSNSTARTIVRSPLPRLSTFENHGGGIGGDRGVTKDQMYSSKTTWFTVGEGELQSIMRHQESTIFDQIITLRDAQRIYHRDRKTILLQCDKGRIRAQRIGNNWLLMRADLDRIYTRTNG